MQFAEDISDYSTINFDYEVLDRCPEADLFIRESFWIDHFNSIENGYNVTQCYSSSKPVKERIINLKDYKTPKMPEHLKHLSPAKEFSAEDLRKIYVGTYKPPYEEIQKSHV